MSVTIRPATTEDADELARLRWEFRIESGTPASLARDAFDAEMRAFVGSALADGAPWRAWVVADDDRLVGCVWLHLVEKVPHPGRARWERPIAYVTSMYVEPERRNGGLGRELIDAAIGFARAREVDGVVLWPSPRSRPFYERAGFGGQGGPLWLGIAGD
jgi:GNAT superfamily N-acetyltransferase